MLDAVRPVELTPGQSIGDLLRDAISLIKPPPDIGIVEFATNKDRPVYMVNPDTGRVAMSFDETPYQKAVCDTLSGTEFEGATLVAPSRAGKSAMLLPLMHFTAEIDPKDTMIIAPTRTAAGIYAKGDFAKYIEANPDFKARIQPGRVTNAQLMKVLRNGMIVSIVWPTATNLAGVDRGVIAIMDYDRIKADVSGEGSVYNQAKARTKLYGPRKKILAESSPSRLPDDLEPFEPTSPHLAPPFPGIFSLYNDGTRECWYWKCLDGCGEYFEAHPRRLVTPEEGTAAERAKATHISCPHCDCRYYHDGEDGGASKYHLNRSGIWVPDGMTADKDGNLHGARLSVSKTRSFWLTGVAAAWQRWDAMVEARIKAEEKLRDTGDETELKNVINTDYGLPYFPTGLISSARIDEMMARAQAHPYSRKVMPKAARYLVTTVDVQGDRWVLQTQAFDLEGRMWVIHRKQIWASKRTKYAPSGEVVPANVSPFTIEEDWDVLADYLKGLDYAVEGRDDVRIRPAVIGIDSGGGGGKRGNMDDEESTSSTYLAYKFWRKLRDGATGIHERVHLLKGEHKAGAPFIERRMQGETSVKNVPVQFIGTTASKDLFAGLLDRAEEGPGFVYLPSWETGRWWYSELLSEEKRGGRWEKIRRRNEAWDLCVYAHALIRMPSMRGDQILTMTKIPDYALPIDQNPHAMRVRDDGATEPAKPVEDWRAKMARHRDMAKGQ